MTVNFTELLENAELTEDVKTALQEAWEGKISEAREELTAELREEFAQRYEHDKGQIVEAVDNFISEKVSTKYVTAIESLIKLTLLIECTSSGITSFHTKDLFLISKDTTFPFFAFSVE